MDAVLEPPKYLAQCQCIPHKTVIEASYPLVTDVRIFELLSHYPSTCVLSRNQYFNSVSLRSTLEMTATNCVRNDSLRTVTHTQKWGYGELVMAIDDKELRYKGPGPYQLQLDLVDHFSDAAFAQSNVLDGRFVTQHELMLHLDSNTKLVYDLIEDTVKLVLTGSNDNGYYEMPPALSHTDLRIRMDAAFRMANLNRIIGAAEVNSVDAWREMYYSRLGPLQRYRRFMFRMVKPQLQNTRETLTVPIQTNSSVAAQFNAVAAALESYHRQANQ